MIVWRGVYWQMCALIPGKCTEFAQVRSTVRYGTAWYSMYTMYRSYGMVCEVCPICKYIRCVQYVQYAQYVQQARMHYQIYPFSLYICIQHVAKYLYFWRTLAFPKNKNDILHPRNSVHLLPGVLICDQRSINS